MWWKAKKEKPEDIPFYTVAQYEKALQSSDFYKGLLFDAWKSLAQQQKGMRRMARKIKRLQARVKGAP
jgi:hypothetical protein